VRAAGSRHRRDDHGVGSTVGSVGFLIALGAMVGGLAGVLLLNLIV
jgi:proteasome assembly chaperone (PAC2) family protein